MWLERPDQWDKLAEHLRNAGEFGFDTETYGQPDKTSPQHRARVHCWSVGLLTATASPRGYRRGVGRVLPRSALLHPSIRRVFADPGIRKWAHNAPHDRHAAENEGVEVRGLEDSLQYLRVACPGRLDYGLKSAEAWALGYGPRPSFMDMVSYQARVVNARGRTERGCVCGATPCRARSTAEWLDMDGCWRPHTRVSWRVYSPVVRMVPARYDVTDFVPGSRLEPIRWLKTKDKPTPPGWWHGTDIDRLTAWWEYSLADAVRGMELVDWMRGQKPARVVFPWQTSRPLTKPTTLPLS
jgi:hypothetical protein